MFALILSLAIGAAPSGTAINIDVVHAAKDIATLPASDQCDVRYFSLYNVPAASADDFMKSLVLAVNQLSRDSQFYYPKHVGGTCYRLDITDFGWKKEVWEKLSEVDPYYHQHRKTITYKETVKRVKKRRGRQDPRTGRWYDIEEYWVDETVKEEVVKVECRAAAWIEPAAIATLEKYTQSTAPIVRADWFLWQTGGQVNRKGAGYYDFLGVTNQADFDKLVGLDRKTAERVHQEIAAIIRRSGVTHQSRQIWRYNGHVGAVWESRDVARTRDRVVDAKKNALNKLDRDYEPDAFETFYRIPNGLWGLSATNNKGELQAFVPGNIASDHFSTSNYRRIEPGASCLRCHTNGLQPLNDFARKLYKNRVLLTAKNKEELRRLERLYLGPLKDNIDTDLLLYGKALKRLNGWTAADVSKIYTGFFYRYEEADMDAAACATELGVTEVVLIKSIETALAVKDYIPKEAQNTLASLTADEPIKVRREHFEDYFFAFMLALGYSK